MKIRKLLVCALTAAMICATVSTDALAAESYAAGTVTEEESTDKSANEDTASTEPETSAESQNPAGSKEESPEAEASEESASQDKEEAESEDEIEEEKEEKKEEKEEKKAKKEAKKKSASAKAAKEEKKASYKKSDLRLLASLIFCEAGSEPYAGKVAVGIVVMNRKASKSFPDTLKGVIYQKYQFGPVRNGSLSKALSNYDAGKFTSSYHKDCIKAAKVALGGAKKVTYKGKEINMKNTLYFSGRVSGAKFSIGNHQFK